MQKQSENMLSNSKRLSEIKNRLRPILRNNDVIDVILFGSVVKGKTLPRDIDVAIISEEDIKPNVEGFHFSVLKQREFFKNQPTLVTTLLREGHSLRLGKPFCEGFRFKSGVMFVYNLTSLNSSEKVRIVNLLRGKGGGEGLVKEYRCEWISNNVFIAPLEGEYIIEQFLIKNKVNFKKSHILIH